VAFDALEAATSRDVDVVIVDTAGRMHTKVNLMEEIKKVHRVIQKKMPGAPHEILLVLDATTGQNALSQARLFKDTVGVSGLVLTKLDGTAKGGVIVPVCHELQLPVRFIGVGEKVEDLRPFDPEEFARAIV
jgi:fused signal recognition particle receptor